ncbi:type I glyceraldehyde-3-phosphate dehydrogenase [Paenibacillus faecalis]|uniref:type I glyceraldehyde-3-phosphate dehydrogenase n=1 Tax=Paenibacillus faecalis TaxID=2079532 RepID=UPI000D0EC914|nr:type I glyceraldehyde-3-phosphate dehydrogenase [Paenibacillus faecalis]
MALPVAVNGMGRIGRLVFRRAMEESDSPFRIQAVNTLYPASTIAHLLKYDSIHGKWNADISSEGNVLIINDTHIPVLAEADPANLPWSRLGIHTVIDATGKFTDRPGASKHIEAGAEKVIVTAPGKQLDLTVVMGVNEWMYNEAEHQLVSAASCTTNCLAPVLYILDQSFGIVSGWMTTIHSYTNDQKHLDNPHQDLRRARACTQSIVPTSTGVGKALASILPNLASSVQGISVRVPTPDVSLVDLTAEVKEPVTADDVRFAFLHAIRSGLDRYVEWCDDPLVSTDFIGHDKSAVIDGLSLMANDRHIKLLAWYDNEWAYAARVVDLTRHMTQEGVKGSWQTAAVR